MKRVLCVLVLVLLLTNMVCSAEMVYPKYSVANENQTAVTERVNIVFDNSGHEYVKSMLIYVIRVAAVAENSDVWIYPVAGSNEPIKVEPTEAFVNKYFAQYSKSSNEFKAENMVEKAINDLNADTAVQTKRFILYADYNTADIRPEYGIYQAMDSYMDANPEIKFTTFNSNGNIYVPAWVSDIKPNYEYMSNENILNFFLIKNGYSLCESTYSQEEAVIKLEKGKVNNNIVVLLNDTGYRRIDSEQEEVNAYISGCAMNEDAYETYKKKSKVKGVALSYNHVLTDAVDTGRVTATALYTLDGQNVNPLESNIYIPVINATNVSVYHRETKGAGVCNAETVYDCAQDKKVTNMYYVEPEVEETEAVEKDIFTLAGFEKTTEKNESVVSKIFSVAGTIIVAIIKLLFALIRLLLFAFVIALVVSRKFRAYVQLKILATKFGPSYEKTLIKIKKFFKDVSNSGKQIKGTADLNGKFIFISKASADMATPNNRIELLVSALEEKGIQCWTSEKGIKPGQNYNVVLPEAIRKCSLFLLFVSTMSVKSSDVVSEIGTAKEYKKNIIPVQIEPFDLFKEFPDWAYMLKQYQKTDLLRSKPEEIKQLADYIEQMFNEIK